ncbi:growth-regulating factor 2 [Striga asiatica]|uniref:Growth-regulating factor n=1 Tax=Striga asiatica TaxID=4170 RepID=A0A5A7PDT6_STRAF|nr:growth-regulating factor 2 [Striga asiatica]
MDFGLVDTSSAPSSAPNNGGGLFGLDITNGADEACNNMERFCRLGLSKRDRAVNVNKDDFRDFKKTSKISSVQRSDGCDLADDHQQMLSFSSPSSQTSSGFSRNSGYGSSGSVNMQQGVIFTPSQWMELEHQTLIYKYITANVPIPSYLLKPIRKAFESVGFLGFPGFRSGVLGWGGLDPEPGRCRRTDGKKWRCSKEVVADQKYCERHINRGRHRSRKPVEGQSAPYSTTTNTNNNNHHPSRIPDNMNRGTTQNKDEPLYQKNDTHKSKEDEFGLVCSDSLLNPLNQTSSLLNLKTLYNNNNSNLEGEMGLGLSVGPAMGGPLGEALWDGSSPRASPTGVLQRGAFGSLSNSPRAGPGSGIFGPGLAGPLLPTI